VSAEERLVNAAFAEGIYIAGQELKFNVLRLSFEKRHFRKVRLSNVTSKAAYLLLCSR
jgi:hypothetical protein